MIELTLPVYRDYETGHDRHRRGKTRKVELAVQVTERS